MLEVYMCPVLPLPIGFWDGVTMRMLVPIAADRSGYLTYCMDTLGIETAADLSERHGGVAPHLVSLYRCALGRVLCPLAQALATEDDDSADRVRIKHAAEGAIMSFEEAHGFRPNIACVLGFVLSGVDEGNLLSAKHHRGRPL